MNPLWDHDTELRQYPPDFVGHGDTGFDETLAGAMHGQDGLLLHILDRDKAHVRSGDRFADGGGIRHIVLIGLDVGLNELRRHQLDGVTEAFKFTCDVVRTPTGLHTDQTARKLGEELGHLYPA